MASGVRARVITPRFGYGFVLTPALQKFGNIPKMITRERIQI